MNVKEFLETILDRELPHPDSKGEINCHCWCHDDQANSCSVNSRSGFWKCFATGGGGDLIDAVKIIKKCGFKEAVRWCETAGIDLQALKVEGQRKSGRRRDPSQQAPPIPEGIVKAFQRNLLHDNEKRQVVHKFWNQQTLERFEIGFDKSPYGQRYTIPIRDLEGQVRNIRMYQPGVKEGGNKVISYSDARHKGGYGTPIRLFPIGLLAEAQHVVICEGEKDCLVMNQVLTDYQEAPAWCAVTATGGAGAWDEEWDKHFDGKDVYIVFDRDDAGEKGAASVASKVVKTAQSVKVIQLDLAEKKSDVTDYFTKSAKSWDDFKRLVEQAEYFTPQTKVEYVAPEQDTKVYRPHLSDAAKSKYLGKLQEIRMVVVGKQQEPFSVVIKGAVDCEMDGGKKCDGCPLQMANGNMRFEFEPDDPFLLSLIDIPDDVRDARLLKHLGVKRQCCASRKIFFEETVSIEELIIQPELDHADLSETEHVTRTAYVTQEGVPSNRSYLMMGTTVPHPKTQRIVHFANEVIPSQDNIDDFHMDKAKYALLERFRPAVGQTIAEKLEEVADDLAHNVTNIYGRSDMVIGVLMCYGTVLAFEFMGRPVAKAWGDILVLGDTGQGKSETLQSLISHIRLGEKIQGEAVSFAGLVGGLQKSSSGSWTETWGRMVINDRRLIMVDEFSGVTTDDIGKMSGIRSEGIAEIIKIKQAKTSARTRFIAGSNPRDDKLMAQHAHGVDAVRKLIGRPEDIRRFDYVLTAAIGEVPIEVINAFKRETVEHVATSETLRLLMLRAWSRKPAHIRWTEEAVKACLALATEQSKRYSSRGVPLVEHSNHRLKLAKLAVSVANITFSTDDPEGETTVVLPEHVEFVVQFLDRIYSKLSLDYRAYSEQQLRWENAGRENMEAVKKWIREHKDWAEYWLSKDELRAGDFTTLFDIEMEDARARIFKPLMQMKMIDNDSKQATYVKTPPFIKAIKEVREMEGLEGGAVEEEAAVPF